MELFYELCHYVCEKKLHEIGIVRYKSFEFHIFG
jgi:hypothetical protein